MAVYKVESPTGEIINIEGPDGASHDEIVAQAQRLYQPKKDAGFTAPLSTMSVEDWKKSSLAYPVLQTMYGLLPFQGKQGEQAFTEGMAGVKQKGDAIVQGVGNIIKNPVETMQGAWNAIKERPMETAGNIVKGTVYDPELLFVPVPGAGNVANAAGTVGRAAVNTGKAVVQAPVDVVKGAVGRATGYIAEPGATQLKGYQVPSSRIPLGETFIPADAMAELRQGMPISEGAVRPISELAPAPVLALSGGQVPVAGQGFKAFGERLGETYRNPLTAAIDIGSLGLTGVPWYTAAKGGLAAVQGAADAYLARKGFTSLTPAEQAALNQGVNPFYKGPGPSGMGGGPAGPVPPRAPSPAPSAVSTQPVNPVQAPVNYGIPAYQRAGTQIPGVNAPVPQRPVAPADIQAAAAEHITPAQTPVEQAAKTQAVIDAESAAKKQQIRDMIAAKTQPVAPTPIAETPAPAVEVPVAQPEAPTIADWAKKKTGTESAGTGEGFATAIEQHRQAMIQDRQARNMPTPDITDAAIVKSMIKQTGNGAVTQSGKRVSVKTELYDDLAKQAGVTLDWSTAPDIANLDRAATRDSLHTWVYDAIREQRPDLGLGSRGPQMRTQQAAAERELGITGKESVSAEEIAALQQRAAKLLGKKYKPPGTMEMMTPTNNIGNEFILQKLAGGELPIGTFELDGIRYDVSPNAVYTNAPEAVKKLMPIKDRTVVVKTDIKTGKVIKNKKD